MNKRRGTLDAIRAGLVRFHREHGHYPTGPEIDECPYLCSSRYIERKYGGLRRLREVLGFEVVDYGKGRHRQGIASRSNRLSIDTENEMRELLVGRYGEICVHEEKKYGSSKQRVDFFVYAKENFAVDVFNTYTVRNLGKNVNIKLHKYRDFPYKLYLVLTGGSIPQERIDVLVSCKKRLPLPPNMNCLTIEEFKKECLRNLPPLSRLVR